MGLFSTPRATMATMGGLGLVLLLVVLSWARSPYGARWWDGLGGPRRGFGVVGPHFQPPDAALWGADAAAPYPTGAYWLNAALGSQPVPVAPYQVAALPQGFQLSYSARRRVATLEAQVDPFGVDWFGLPMGGGDGAADAAATIASLGAAEASVRDALRHLGDLEATGEVRRLGDALAAAAGDLRRCGEATKDGAGGELRRGEAVVLGFHTHGIIPFNAGLMTYGDAWARLVSPTLPRCIVATDAFTHVVPWMRDLGQWLGARECTRECIGKALDDGVSVILVPGGQAEIFSTKSWGDDVTVFRGHRGFVQLALRHRARLVPVFSFGEWEIMDNVHLPRVQRVTRRWFGFPVPFWPYGLLGLPLPRKPPKGITVVIGRPIELPLAKDGRVDDDAVRRCHAKYFDALHDLFERHKAAAGYPKHAIVFDDGPPKHKKKQQ